MEYFRGIRNPIGVKVGPSMKCEELVRLIESELFPNTRVLALDFKILCLLYETVLNPEREPGRLTLITRYGAGNVEKHLPGHIQAVKENGMPVAWICDPMHGK